MQILGLMLDTNTYSGGLYCQATALVIVCCAHLEIYSTELKTQHLIYQKIPSSFSMQTSNNLISLFWGT